MSNIAHNIALCILSVMIKTFIFLINHEWNNSKCKCKAIFVELGLHENDYNRIKPFPPKKDRMRRCTEKEYINVMEMENKRPVRLSNLPNLFLCR